MARTSRVHGFSRVAGAVAACTTVALGLAACGGGKSESAASDSSQATPTATSSAATETSQATPTPTDSVAADQALVRSLYYDDSHASAGTLADEAAFIAAHNHPDFKYAAAECEQSLRGAGLTDDHTISEVPDVAAMAPDPGWGLPSTSGRYAGMKPSGRIYLVPLQYSETDPKVGLNNSTTQQVHVSILDGVAYYFQSCEG